MKVVVLTGSRAWTDRAAIERALMGAELLIVGDCPTGADAIALEVAIAWDIIPVVFVADWAGLGDAAGPTRNTAMVAEAVARRELGFDVHCFAAPLPGSRGTYDCMRKLAAAGFTVLGVNDDR